MGYVFILIDKYRIAEFLCLVGWQELLCSVGWQELLCMIRSVVVGFLYKPKMKLLSVFSMDISRLFSMLLFCFSIVYCMLGCTELNLFKVLSMFVLSSLYTMSISSTYEYL
jgi:hypothetical protein